MDVTAREAIAASRNEVLVCAASIWEQYQRQAMLLELPQDIGVLVEDSGLGKLPISLFRAQRAGALPESIEIHSTSFSMPKPKPKPKRRVWGY